MGLPAPILAATTRSASPRKHAHRSSRGRSQPALQRRTAVVDRVDSEPWLPSFRISSEARPRGWLSAVGGRGQHRDLRLAPQLGKQGRPGTWPERRGSRGRLIFNRPMQLARALECGRRDRKALRKVTHLRSVAWRRPRRSAAAMAAQVIGIAEGNRSYLLRSRNSLVLQRIYKRACFHCWMDCWMQVGYLFHHPCRRDARRRATLRIGLVATRNL